MSGNTIIFFDVEGGNEVPYRKEYNFEKNITTILDILKTNNVKAVFNICGVLAKNFPQIIQTIYDEGHEIGSHGYAHENFLLMNRRNINKILEKTEQVISKILGQKPSGFRAPWLKYPRKHYDILVKRGYLWSSNSRACFYRARERHQTIHRALFAAGYSLLINLGSNIEGMFSLKKPYKVDGIYEIPLLSSMDGELLDDVDPLQHTPQHSLQFAYNKLISQYLKSRDFFDLNFHDWLIGSANRPVILEKILNHLTKNTETKFVLGKDLVNQLNLNE